MIAKYEREAKQFVAYVRMLAEKPENIDNLEHYLSSHFSEWLKKFAGTPADIVCELREFAKMKI